MIFVAKSAPIKEQLEDKLRKGFSNIELQLIKYDITNEIDIITSVRGLNVVGVHTPLILKDKMSDDISLEYLVTKEYLDILDNTCKLSQQLAEYYRHDVYVVIHNSFNKENYEKIHILTDYIINIFGELINKYKNINFYIENISPLDFEDNFRNGTYLEDTKYIVDVLNSHYNNKFGITFDTCHMMMTEQIYNKLTLNNEKTNLSHYKKRQFDYDYIFSNFSDNIQNIHLNNILRCGSTPKTHGTPFLENEKDIKILKDLLDKYIKYHCMAYITLEIREDNYNDCINILNTYNLICKIIRKEI